MDSKKRYVVEKSRPLLEQEKIKKDYYGTPNSVSIKFRKWHKTYLVFAFSFICIIACLLLVWAWGRGEINISSNFWSDLSKDLLEIFLPNEAPSNPQEDDSSEHPPKDEPDDIPTNSTPPEESIDNNNILKDIYSFDYSKVPNGEIAILPSDLSYVSMGQGYINNSTGYSPDINSLINASLSNGTFLENISNTVAPQVLIIHTHATEAYSSDDAVSYLDDGSDLARSVKEEDNVISLGAVMTNILNQNGISAIHCKIAHDQPQYKDSYLRARETIEKYLQEYPSIKLVIDIHRDAIFNASEEMIRPVTLVNGEETAQVMCVVGSDWGGDNYPDWESNLSLALKIRKFLNDKYLNVCRPTDLRSATYNQELSKYSLLIEIGSCGNSIEEATRAVSLVGEAIVEIAKNIP